MVEKKRINTFGNYVKFDYKPSDREIEEAIHKLDSDAVEYMEKNGLMASGFTRHTVKHDGEVFDGVLTLPWTVALRFDEVKRW